jgi:alpha-glucosidase
VPHADVLGRHGAGGFTDGTPWLPVKPPQRARNVAAQEGVPGSVLESYREMLAFRRLEWALRHGRSRFLDLPEPVLAFQRGEAMARCCASTTCRRARCAWC